MSDRFGRPIVFRGEPYSRPNRAARRRAGIRTPLAVLDAAQEMIDEDALSEERLRSGSGAQPS